MSIGPELELQLDTKDPFLPQCRAVGRRHTEVGLVQPTRPVAISDPLADVQAERDRTMEAQARAELDKSSYYAVRQLSCEVCDCLLTLRGRVPSFYLKQIAQTVVRHIEGIVILDNHVEVDRA